MNHSGTKNASYQFLVTGWTGVLLLVAVMLTLGACGGSTKVYTAQKTIVYNGELFNVANVQKIGSSLTGTKPNGDTVNMRTMDKRAAQDLFNQVDYVTVKAAVTMDQQEMVYMNGRVTKYSDYTSVEKKFDRALNSINKFMADKKKTQLKLK